MKRMTALLGLSIVLEYPYTTSDLEIGSAIEQAGTTEAWWSYSSQVLSGLAHLIIRS